MIITCLYFCPISPCVLTSITHVYLSYVCEQLDALRDMNYKNQSGPEQAKPFPSVCALLLRLQFNLFFSDPCDRWASFPPSLPPSLQKKQLCPVKGGVFEVRWKLCHGPGGLLPVPPGNAKASQLRRWYVVFFFFFCGASWQVAAVLSL